LSNPYSDQYGWRFQDFGREADVYGVFGIENTANFTVVRCPVCGLRVWVPRGQFDVTHNCTLICPYSGDQMWYIPGNPALATDHTGAQIILQGLGGADASEQLIEEFKRYFMYCPNSKCSFYTQNGFAFIQRRVETEIQVGR